MHWNHDKILNFDFGEIYTAENIYGNMSIPWKHILHVITLALFIALVENITINRDRTKSLEPPSNYYLVLYSILYAIQYIILLSLPQVLFNFMGLISFNAFPGKVKITEETRLNLGNLPHICFRVVTRGLYPDLVRRNLAKNLRICNEVGLSNYSIEVVSDMELGLLNAESIKAREIVVPKSYQTSTRAMFKARALQYALEPDVNILKRGDYIVHLDEETLLTTNSVHGIVNFVLDGRYDFGQGYITYGNQEVVNWITTLADSIRVADDMGKMRFQFRVFHKPLFSWKGSYVVTKYEAESDVSYDHGPDGSIAEDCYFSMIAFKKGYSFQFIEGEMWEKSPHTIMDLIRQRKRWIQGIWLVVHSNKIPLSNKFFLAMSLYSWSTLPITTINFIMAHFLPPITSSMWMDIIGSFCFAVSVYMYIFGVLKTFELKQTNVAMLSVYLIGSMITLSLNIVAENIAVIWGVFSPKHQFYIVEKDIPSRICLEV